MLSTYSRQTTSRLPHEDRYDTELGAGMYDILYPKTWQTFLHLQEALIRD